MKTIIGIALYAVSVICIVLTIWQLANGEILMFSIETIGAIVFHIITAMVAGNLVKRKGGVTINESMDS